jgi:hypothetical protein
MVHDYAWKGEFFEFLTACDAKMAAAVAAAGCRHCGGPLHKAYYRRKPRGALLATEGESYVLRHSLCCGRSGCRRRALPPSLRFLGRKVYLEIVVLLVSAMAMMAAKLGQPLSSAGVPRRTVRRWLSWWTQVFPSLPAWAELRARFAPPPPVETELPQSLVSRLEVEVSAPVQVVTLAARLLTPVTTGSVQQVSRFLRGLSWEPNGTGFTQKMSIFGIQPVA